MVLGYAKAGKDAEAKKLLDEFKKKVDSDPKAGSRKGALAMLQAATGDAAGAVKWAEELKSPEDRANALMEVSIGLAYRELWKSK